MVNLYSLERDGLCKAELCPRYTMNGITNLLFVNDIGALAEKEQKLEALVDSLDKKKKYKMEISA